MKITGEISVRAARQRVFELLQDAHFFASCIDGVKDLVETEPRRYDAVFETRVAYLKFRFKVSVEMTCVAAPDAIEARIEGTPLGVVGRISAVSATRLTECGDETLISYAIDANLTGKLGSLGQPVLRAKARDMERQFTDRLRAAFDQPVEAAS